MSINIRKGFWSIVLIMHSVICFREANSGKPYCSKLEKMEQLLKEDAPRDTVVEILGV